MMHNVVELGVFPAVCCPVSKMTLGLPFFFFFFLLNTVIFFQISPIQRSKVLTKKKKT